MPVTCPYCQTHFPNSNTINSRHKASCLGWANQLGDTKPRPCLCGHESTSGTQMKRHRTTCETWKSRDRGEVQTQRLTETLQEKYGEGVTKPIQVEGAKEKRDRTNLERYGSENVFSRESNIFNKVQASLDGKRPILKGSDNPFAWPEVQEKIRKTNLEKYGVENPQQAPEVRDKAQQTNLKKYGVLESLAAPQVRQQIAKTNKVKYGGVAPSCSPEVVEKARQTNLDRWGVEWTNQHPDIREKQYQAQIARYGDLFFASEEGKAKVREALIAKYGVNHPAKIDGFWERTVATFVRKYGAEHPLMLAEYLDKRRDTCLQKFGFDAPLRSPEIYASLVETVREKYGVDNVFQSKDLMEGSFEKARESCVRNYGVEYAIQSEIVKEQYRQTSIKNYGVNHPMKNREHARERLEKIRRPGPNLPERMLHSLAPQLIYTGNGTFWRWLSLLNHHKNPDFILPGPDPENPKKGVTKVVEMFGDFWHSRMMTGKANFEHEQELIEAYADIGIQCQIVWESDVKKRRQEVKDLLEIFLSA